MHLELYYFESCPYCQKVLRFLEDKEHNIKFYDTRKNFVFREQLKELNGTTQVPCLVVNGKSMLESDDIIEFLNKHL